LVTGQIFPNKGIIFRVFEKAEIDGEVVSGLEKKECVELESKQRITLKKSRDKWYCAFTIKHGETKVLKLY